MRLKCQLAEATNPAVLKSDFMIRLNVAHS